MRSTPCSGKALRTVCSGSVRGGSKVGRARAAEGAAQSMKPLPSLAMGGTGLSVWSLPLPGLAPWLRVVPPGPALNGEGALPLVYVRCCWPSHCSAVGHGIKALRGRHHRGNGTR